MVALQQGAQPVLGPGLLANQALAMVDQRSQFPHVCRWHPHRRDHADGQQLGQGHRIFLVGLDQSGGDQLDLGRMADHHPRHQRFEQVVNVPRIGGRFQNHLVGRAQMFFGPALELGQTDLARWQHHLLIGVDRPDHHVMFVDIQAHIAFLLISHMTSSDGTNTAEPSGHGETCRFGLLHALHTPIRA